MLNDKQRKQVVRRLRIIRGQVEGLERMIEEGKYCVDVLTQVSAIHEALRGVGKAVVRNHLETCVARDLKRGEGQHHFDELVEIMHKLSR
jgi:DNA-binding FrmR family transcriptional regulator